MRSWKDGFNDTEREKEYVQMKESQRNQSFADGSIGAAVRLLDGQGRILTHK